MSLCAKGVLKMETVNMGHQCWYCGACGRNLGVYPPRTSRLVRQQLLLPGGRWDQHIAENAAIALNGGTEE